MWGKRRRMRGVGRRDGGSRTLWVMLTGLYPGRWVSAGGNSVLVDYGISIQEWGYSHRRLGNQTCTVTCMAFNKVRERLIEAVRKDSLFIG